VKCFVSYIEGNGSGRDGLGGPHHHDSSKSPEARSGAGSDRSPDIRDSCAGRERRAPNAGLVHQKSTSSRLSDEVNATVSLFPSLSTCTFYVYPYPNIRTRLVGAFNTSLLFGYSE